MSVDLAALVARLRPRAGDLVVVYLDGPVDRDDLADARADVDNALEGTGASALFLPAGIAWERLDPEGLAAALCDALDAEALARLVATIEGAMDW